MKCRKIKNKKGFTLIEIMVSIFVFTLIMTVVSGIFAGFYSSFRISKNQQRMFEQANDAINIMTKVIRTSTVVNMASSGDTKDLRVFDHSQDKNPCVLYSFSNGVLKMGVGTSKNANNCKGENISAANTLLDSSGSGGNLNFRVTLPTDKSAGKVTISFLDDSIDTLPISIQSTVLLRNWSELVE